MKKILLITSSPRGEASHSRDVAHRLVHRLNASHGETSLVERDLSSQPLPHIDTSFVQAVFTPEESRSDAQKAQLALSDDLVDELMSADILIIASGMINFGISSQLKAWIDHIARAGKTFTYGEKGPAGLVTGKKAYLIASSGGIYSSGPMAQYNHQDTYLRSVLGFLGVSDVETIYVEGVSYGPEQLDAALSKADAAIESIVAA